MLLHSVERQEILSHWKKISSNQLFSYLFSKPLFLRNFCEKMWERISEISTLCSAHCGNYGNLLSRSFGKNFVKVTVLLKKLLNSWFDEKISVRINFSFYHGKEL